RRAADLQAQARLGDHADALAAVELEAGFAAPADGRGPPGAVGDVGVVAGVLDHDCLGFLAWCDRAGCNRKFDALTRGQPDVHGVLDFAGAQRGGGRLGRRGSAGPGGPAGAQRLLPDLGRTGQVGFAEFGFAGAGHGPSWRVVPARSCCLAWRSARRKPWKWPGWYR